MTPLPDGIASGDLGPSLMGAALRTLGALLLIAAAVWAWLARHRRGGRDRRELRVLDRAALTRGAGLALVSVAGRRLLLGVSNDGVRLLTDLRDVDPSFDTVLVDAGTARDPGKTP